MTSKKKRVLLVDGDVLAYQAASSSEKDTDWGEGFHVLWTHEADLEDYMEKWLDTLRETLEPDGMVFALSDSKHNWRKDVLPTYKANRKNTRKPLGLSYCKDYLREMYETYERPSLEADDILGILSTSKRIIKANERIIVSVDKDFYSIHGLFYRLTEPEAGVQSISKQDADRYHLLQSIAGDPTDGYKGCPGLGVKRGARLLDEVAPEHWWDKVVEAYENAGLSEEEALVQARVARILRANDYDFKRKKVKLWKPSV